MSELVDGHDAELLFRDGDNGRLVTVGYKRTWGAGVCAGYSFMKSKPGRGEVIGVLGWRPKPDLRRVSAADLPDVNRIR